MSTKKRILGGIIGILIPIIFSQIPVAAPLTQKSMIAIGLLIGAVTWILTNALSDYQAMLTMCVLLSVTNCVPISVAFGTFSTSTWWLMFGAIGIGVAATESGFLRRIALLMMKALPATFKGQCLAFILSGFIISPIIPSSTAKGAIVAPLARSTSEALGYEPHSKPAVGIYLAFFTGYVSIALAFLTGSAVNYSVIGTMPAGQEVSWMKWFITAIPWMIASTILMLLCIFKYYEPKEKTVITKEHIIKQLEALGPWTRNEKLSLTIILICLALWMSESFIHLDAGMVACLGFVVMFALGVCKKESFRTKMGWEPLLFVGCFLCLPTVFAKLGINKWIALTVGDSLAPLMSNTYLFVLAICLLVFVIRLLLVSLSATAILVTTLLLPFCPIYHIHPFVVAFVAYVSTNTWNVSYQNTVTIAALAATDNKWVTHGDIFSGSIFYMITSTLACLLSIPVWKMMGLC